MRVGVFAATAAWSTRITQRGRTEPLAPANEPVGAFASPELNPARRAICRMDDYLSRQHGVVPFTHDRHCILRYAPVPAGSSVRLSDGTRIEAGSLIVELHLWNEHIPRIPRSGPSLTWAHDLATRFRYSLELLARFVATNPALAEARACRARTNFVGWGCSGDSLTRLAARVGFEEVEGGPASMPSQLHDRLEDMLVAALVWTHNPASLRRDKMIRQRRTVWIGRDRLFSLHGPDRGT